MALAVTEDWIRERVKLKHNNLEDVRSLALPGTYHEKISAFGDALRNFSRIKTLDLSRNAIESLQGLENLKVLEKLVLYYNNIPTLQELYRLRYNQRLQELDLRLNPVARNEPDYRLFLIHMLPNLRRLDDRAVRDSERKAALMHFSTDQANELTVHAPRPLTSQPSTNPRVEHVKSLAKPLTAVDHDDAVLLDFANKTTEEVLGPRQLTGSRNTQPAVEEYPPQVLRQMDRAQMDDGYYLPPSSLPYPNTTEYSQNEPTSLPCMTHEAPMMYPVMAAQTNPPVTSTSDVNTEPGAILSAKVADDLQKMYPNLMGPAVLLGPEENIHYGYELQVPKRNGQNTDDANLKYQDEIEAYTAYKAQGHFTPHPDSTQQVEVTPVDEASKQSTSPQYDDLKMAATAELYTIQPPASQAQVPSLPPDVTADDDESQSEEFRQFLERVSDLVDKYWNGSKSLLKNPRFKHHLSGLFNAKEVSPQSMPAHPSATSQEVMRLREELQIARDQNIRLREHTRAMMEDTESGAAGADETKDRGSMIRAQRDLSILRSRLQKSMEENNTLQERNSALESGQPVDRNHSGRTGQGDVESIKMENERLRSDIASLKIRMKQASQMQELAAMLQESHKSLVQSNDHLLRELDETRQRHTTEIKQLHWSYEQLKKSVTGAPLYAQPAAAQPQQGAAPYVLQGAPLFKQASHSKTHNGTS